VFMGSKDADETLTEVTSAERVRQTINACIG